MSDAFWDDLKKDLEDYEFRKEYEKASKADRAEDRLKGLDDG